MVLILRGSPVVASLSGSLVEIGRFVRFGIVGIAAATVYAAASVSAVDIFYLNPVSGSVCGQLFATSVSYFGHSMFSFAVKTDHRRYLWRFLVIAALTYAMNAVVTYLLTDVLLISYLISIAIVAILIPLTNYLCNRFWVFKPGLRNDAVTPDRKLSPKQLEDHLSHLWRRPE
jgi:putative flippase GtrA